MFRQHCMKIFVLIMMQMERRCYNYFVLNGLFCANFSLSLLKSNIMSTKTGIWIDHKKKKIIQLPHED
jgi:hypothetical protein